MSKRLKFLLQEAVHSFVDACILFVKVLGFRFEPDELSKAYKVADVADAEFRGKLEEYFILLQDWVLRRFLKLKFFWNI